VQNYNKILIIQTAFIGDTILATALIESLHKQNPNCSISICLRKGNESLFKNHPFLEDVIIWDKKNGKYKALWQTLKAIRDKKYDALINLQRYMSTGILTAFSGAKHKIGFDKNPLSFLFTEKHKHPFGDGTHEIERNVQLVKKLGISASDKPKLYPPSIEHIELPVSFITISPSSVWFTKAYPKEKWIEFIDQIPEINILALGGPSDQDYIQSIINESNHNQIHNFCGKASLLESAAIMKKATMNYVNDSAPLHLCSAMDAPVSAIFCSTVKEFGFGPVGENSRIIETKEKLNCRPCGVHGKKSCPKGHFKCGLSIQVKHLLEALPSH
jgi:heptosyltransferase-2